MVIPQKSEILKEIDKINDPELKDEIIGLYEHLLGTKRIEDVKSRIKCVVKKMFQNQYSKDTYIPMEFIFDSNIAKIIFNILYAEEVLYSTGDLMKLTKTSENPNGFTRQYISKEVKEGNIKAVKKGRNFFFTESDVNQYLITKGISVKKRSL